jgi:hypothetical protein
MSNPSKTGKKPTGPITEKSINVGLENQPVSTEEVAGHTSPGAWYWNDGCAHYVPFGWNWFVCRCCGAGNAV